MAKKEGWELIEITDEKIHFRDDPTIEVIVRLVHDDGKVLTRKEIERDKSIILYAHTKDFAVDRISKKIVYGDGDITISNEALMLTYLFINKVLAEHLENYATNRLKEVEEKKKSPSKKSKKPEQKLPPDHKEKYSGKMVISIVSDNGQPIGSLTLENMQFTENINNSKDINFVFTSFSAETSISKIDIKEFVRDLITMMMASAITIESELDSQEGIDEYPDEPPEHLYV